MVNILQDQIIALKQQLTVSNKHNNLSVVFPLGRFFQPISDLLDQGQIIFSNMVNIPLENSTNLWKYDIWYTLILIGGHKFVNPLINDEANFFINSLIR